MKPWSRKLLGVTGFVDIGTARGRSGAWTLASAAPRAGRVTACVMRVGRIQTTFRSTSGGIVGGRSRRGFNPKAAFVSKICGAAGRFEGRAAHN